MKHVPDFGFSKAFNQLTTEAIQENLSLLDAFMAENPEPPTLAGRSHLRRYRNQMVAELIRRTVA